MLKNPFGSKVSEEIKAAAVAAAEDYITCSSCQLPAGTVSVIGQWPIEAIYLRYIKHCLYAVLMAILIGSPQHRKKENEPFLVNKLFMSRLP